MRLVHTLYMYLWVLCRTVDLSIDGWRALQTKYPHPLPLGRCLHFTGIPPGYVWVLLW